MQFLQKWNCSGYIRGFCVRRILALKKKEGSKMSLSLIDKVKADIVRQGYRVLIGFPSDPNRKMKANGIYFSAEYYAKEAANVHRSVMHRLVAEACAKVLTDPEVHELMQARFAEIVDQMEKENGLKVAEEIRADEKAQDETFETAKKSVAKVAKVMTRTMPKSKPKPAPKPIAQAKPKATKTVAKPKTATKTVAKTRTTAKK